MKRLFILFLGICLTQAGLLAQQATIKGTVSNTDGESLIGANVLVEGTTQGASTNIDGNYTLRLSPGTYEVSVSYIGYQVGKVTVTATAGELTTQNFTLSEGASMGAEVVVSGSRKPEKITESPATIETIFAREIEQYAGNPAELLARQKGIDYFRAGVSGVGINIRGFNSNFNSKNLQVTDGRFSTLIATGLPFGPLNTTVKEDIERVEVILGPNSTLYGPNAHNGLLNTITKDPRTSPGTTVALTAGNQSTFSARLRHAQIVNDKFSYKVTAEYSQAEEFDFVDSVYIDRVGAVDSLGNPIRDGVKEGYEEFQLDNDIQFVRAEAGLYYSLNESTDLVFKTGHSNSTYLAPTNVGRNQIKDWRIGYYQLQLTSDHWFAQTVFSTSKTDSTYSIDERTKRYYSGIDGGLSPKEASGAYSYQSGALFQDRSRRWNTEVQYSNNIGGLEFTGGVQYQLDQANSLGTYLLDENEDDYININQFGGYVHLSYEFGDGWEAIAAARGDYHEIYDFNLVPKFGLLKKGDAGTLRLTYGKGIAAPTILNLYGNLFGGLILGNAEGFTLNDGTLIEKQRVEKLQTFEIGYRGQLIPNKMFIDANAYYNISKDFLSPVTVVGVTTKRGDTPIDQVQAAFGVYGGLVATYINFGEFNTYGFDLGTTYYFTPQLSATVNYSYFDYAIDENNLENDFDNSGSVNFLDLLVNAPKHKGSIGLGYNGDKFFGSIFTRFVEKYNYFSSFQIASETLPGFTYRGTPIVEDARSTDAYNYGPLGGFFTVDLSAGYKVNDIFTVSANVSNLFDTEMREFTAAPPTGRLFALELKVNLPAIGQ